MTVINPNSIAGIASVSSQGSTLAIYANNVQFSGSIGVAGTVTYDDVTNVDSIGVITARTGINLTGAGSSVGIRTDQPEVSLDASQATDAFALPEGTTAQRPTGDSKYMRWNSTNSALEIYNGQEWVEIITDYFPTGSVILG
jgi:hypothetical protein